MKMKVKLKFLNSLPDLARKFRFSTDTLNKIDSNIFSAMKCPKCKADNKYQHYLDDYWICEKCDEVYNDNDNYKLGKDDLKIINNNLVNTDNPHIQLLKTVSIDYEIFNITRSLLQEFVRHHIGNDFVVKSTRYTLGRIAKDERILINNNYNIIKTDIFKKNYDIVKDYYYIPLLDFINEEEKLNWIWERYEELYCIKKYKLKFKMSNDKLKKYINEYMFTNLTGNISGLCLKNILKQRLDIKAFSQFRDLAYELYKTIPEEWKFLFKISGVIK